MKALEEALLKLNELREIEKVDPQLLEIDDELYELIELIKSADLKPGEPIFVIRGQDVASADGIDAYGLSATWKGATIEFQEAVNARAREFREWQRLNPKYVKRPD